MRRPALKNNNNCFDNNKTPDHDKLRVPLLANEYISADTTTG